MRATHPTKYWLPFLLIIASQFSATEQEPRSRDQDEPIRLKSDLVIVSASVIDPNGRAIKSLKTDDFTIYEDGVKQKIAHFAAGTTD